MEIRKEWTIPAGVGIVSFAAGVLVGHILSRRYFVKAIDDTEKEIEQLKEEQLELDFKRADLDREFNQHIQEMAFVVRELKEEGQKFLSNFKEPIESEDSEEMSHSEVSEEIEESEENLSANYTNDNNSKKEAIMPIRAERDDGTLVRVYADGKNDGWDWDEEMARRSESHPYVIHRDEFFNQEAEGYSQSTLEYYAGDDILCDENDIPLYEAAFIVGKLEFGRGSGDKSICYVRNDKLMAEYEVLLNEGYFGREILGQHVQDLLKKARVMKHSVPKFRLE